MAFHREKTSLCPHSPIPFGNSRGPREEYGRKNSTFLFSPPNKRHGGVECLRFCFPFNSFTSINISLYRNNAVYIRGPLLRGHVSPQSRGEVAVDENLKRNASKSEKNKNEVRGGDRGALAQTIVPGKLSSGFGVPSHVRGGRCRVSVYQVSFLSFPQTLSRLLSSPVPGAKSVPVSFGESVALFSFFRLFVSWLLSFVQFPPVCSASVPPLPSGSVRSSIARFLHRRSPEIVIRISTQHSRPPRFLLSFLFVLLAYSGVFGYSWFIPLETVERRRWRVSKNALFVRMHRRAALRSFVLAWIPFIQSSLRSEFYLSCCQRRLCFCPCQVS